MQIMLPIVKASEALKSLTQILMGFFDLVVPQYSCDDGNLFQTGLQNAPLTKRFCEHHLSLSWGAVVKWWIMLGWSSSHSVPIQSESWTPCRPDSHSLSRAKCVYCVAEVKEVRKK